MRRAAQGLLRFSSLVGHQAGTSSLPAAQVGPSLTLSRRVHKVRRPSRNTHLRSTGMSGMQAATYALLQGSSRAFATNSHDIFNMVSTAAGSCESSGAEGRACCLAQEHSTCHPGQAFPVRASLVKFRAASKGIQQLHCVLVGKALNYALPATSCLLCPLPAARQHL